MPEHSPNPAALQPYPGLRPFREAEEFLFFGREAQVDAMIDKLATTRFLAVVGSSGSGKSSLINCGLRPALHRGLMSSAGSAWRIAQFRPGGTPLVNLAQALAQALGLPASPPFSAAELVATTLRMSRMGLADAFRQSVPDPATRLLVVVDQFEELFRFAVGAAAGEEARAFVALLLATLESEQAIYLAITLRSDFLGDCAQFAGLPEAINAGQYLVPRLNRAQRRSAIVAPAVVCGAQISPALAARLVDDVGDNPDQLSLLQHALNRTWARWRAEGGAGPLDLAHYEAVGGIAQALNQHAEEAWASLPDTGARALCERLFKALTDSAGEVRGVRRPQRFAALCAITGAAPAAVAAVVDAFRAADRSFLMPPADEPLDPDAVVDLAHESLMRIWTRLRAWSEDEAQNARLLRRLADSAELHAAGHASLWRDPELQIALDWRARLAPQPAWAALYGVALAPALAFLDASAQAQQAERDAQAERHARELQQARERARDLRRRRLTTAIVVVALVVAGVFAALLQRAEHARELAVSRQLAAQANTELALHPNDLALLLAVAAQRVYPTFEAREALLAALQQAPRAMLWPAQGGVVALARRDHLLATAGADHSVSLWDLRSRKRLLRLPPQPWALRSVALSADGRLLAAAGEGEEVLLWQLPTGRPLASLRGHRGALLALAFAPDGTSLLGGGEDRLPHRWSLPDGRRLAQADERHADSIAALAWSPDGRAYASAGYDGVVRVWPRDGEAVRVLEGEADTGLLRALAWSPDGRQLAVAGNNRRILRWDVASGRLLGPPLTDSGDKVRALAWSPDGRQLASAGDDLDVRLWDLASGRQVQPPWRGHRAAVTGLAFGADGSLVSAGEDDAICLRRPGTLPRHAHAYPAGDTPRYWALSWAEDGSQLAAARQDGSVALFDRALQRLRELPTAGPARPLALAWQGGRLARLSEGGQLDFPLGGGASQRVEGLPRGLAWAPDGSALALPSDDGKVRWLAGEGGTAAPAQPLHRGPVFALAFAPDGRRYASAGPDGRVRVWAWPAHDLLAELTVPAAGTLYRLSWHPDGQQLAVATQRQGVLLWRPGRGAAAESLQARARPVTQVAFSPDGQLLASADLDGELLLWDTVSRLRLRQPLGRHRGAILALAWHPDGRSLTSAGLDGRLMRWDTDPETWADYACAIAGRELSAAEWREHLGSGARYFAPCESAGPR